MRCYQLATFAVPREIKIKDDSSIQMHTDSSSTVSHSTLDTILHYPTVHGGNFPTTISKLKNVSFHRAHFFFSTPVPFTWQKLLFFCWIHKSFVTTTPTNSHPVTLFTLTQQSGFLPFVEGVDVLC